MWKFSTLRQESVEKLSEPTCQVPLARVTPTPGRGLQGRAILAILPEIRVEPRNGVCPIASPVPKRANWYGPCEHSLMEIP